MVQCIDGFKRERGGKARSSSHFDVLWIHVGLDSTQILGMILIFPSHLLFQLLPIPLKNLVLPFSIYQSVLNVFMSFKV